MIISLLGFMGCGKSSVGKSLAHALKCRFVDLDEAVVSLEGRSIPEMFAEGESVFRAAELRALRSVLDSCAEGETVVLSLGGGTVTVPEALEMVLARTESFYLRTGLETIRARLGESDASRPLFKDAGALYERRAPVYSEAGHIIDTDGLSVREVARDIISILSVR